MITTRILVGVSALVFLVALVLGYLDIDPSVKDLLKDHLPDLGSLTAQPTPAATPAKKTERSTTRAKKRKTDVQELARVFTNKELRYYDGSKSPTDLYLAMLGKVFDVHKGAKHYGPGGSYHFFAGRDATRSFVTGDFTEKGVSDDVAGLSHQDVIGLEEWLSFYESQYKLVGFLDGTYYDSRGRATKKHRDYEQMLTKAKEWQEEQNSETEKLPPCNSEWTAKKGGRVWCSNKSGGIQRDWVGVPRKFFRPGSSVPRCACVRDSGPPTDADPRLGHKNNGDLDHPNLQLYKSCHPSAVSCVMEDS